MIFDINLIIIVKFFCVIFVKILIILETLKSYNFVKIENSLLKLVN